MEKHLVTWSYWLGIACFAIALLWKAWTAFGMLLPKSVLAGPVSYMSFYKGGLLFFLMTVATANYAWFKSRRSQP